MEPAEGFHQHPISASIPESDDEYHKVYVTLSLKQNEVSDGSFSFKFTMEENRRIGENDSDVVVEETNEGVPTGKFFLAIKRNTQLIVVLDRNVNWRWPLVKGVHLTTKGDCSEVYGVNGTFYEEGLLDRITIYCKARDPDVPRDPDGFSFTIEIEQEEEGYWLPITIDPDIKNPPPGGGGNSFRSIKMDEKRAIVDLSGSVI